MIHMSVSREECKCERRTLGLGRDWAGLRVVDGGCEGEGWTGSELTGGRFGAGLRRGVAGLCRLVMWWDKELGIENLDR